MDIIAKFFACFSQKLAPAIKISTDWSARSERFCNSVSKRLNEFPAGLLIRGQDFLPQGDGMNGGHLTLEWWPLIQVHIVTHSNIVK